MIRLNKHNKLPYIISVCSGKGGVGKSVLAANLGNVLSKELSVLIWDADMHFPNQHLLLGVEPPVRLKDVYSGKTDLASAVYNVSDKLYLLADIPAGIGDEKFGKEALQEVYDEIIEQGSFDVVIIDTPAGVLEEILYCCYFSNLICMVITDEPTSLLDAYGLIKILMPYIETEKMMFLVNNVIDIEDANDISRKLNLATENFLKIELEYLGYIPYDRTVRQSILRQELFTALYPESEVSKSIEGISKSILAKIIPDYSFDDLKN
jgi:flagellar biosynthesis protein FlhG